MPSNKILVILIICIGFVSSTYLLTRENDSSFLKENVGSVSVNPYINIGGETNGDWRKILVNVDSSTSTITVLTDNDPDAFNESTLTAQLSRDFLSQYFLSVKDGSVTREQSLEIAKNTLSIPGYTTVGGAKYISSNLKILKKSDKETFQTYEGAINQILRNSSAQLEVHPLVIFKDALNSASEIKMKKLDPIILLNKNVLTELLNMSVPAKAVTVHLAIINTSSDLLADLESLRVVFTDPVRSLAAVSEYARHELNFKTAVTNLNTFLIQNR